MAKQMKDDAGAGGKGMDPSLVKAAIDEIEELESKIDSIKAENAGRCGAVRKEIGKRINEYHKRGVDKVALKAKLEDRKLDLKKKELRDNIDTKESRATFDQMTKLLGGSKGLAETPLGKAALDKTDGKPEPDPEPGAKADNVRDLRPRHMRGKDGEAEAKAIAENTANLSGIKQKGAPPLETAPAEGDAKKEPALVH